MNRRVAKFGHASAFHAEGLPRFALWGDGKNHIPRQRWDSRLTTQNGAVEIDFKVDMQIVPRAFEAGVRFNMDYKV